MVLPIRDMPLKTFFKRLGRGLQDDAAPDLAAQLSYYFLFALFPLLTFIVSLAAYLPLQQPLDEMLARASVLVPAPALKIIEDQLRALLDRPKPQLLTLSLLVALWSASRGVDALRKALNLAYDVTERRPMWRTELLAMGTTVVTSALVLLSFAMVIVGGRTGEWVAAKVGIAPVFAQVWNWLRWPLTAAIVTLAAAINYYLLPDVKQRFHYITPGSVTCTVLWLLFAVGFTQYVANFDNFNVTYGSLGGVIVLLTWLYLSGLVLIVGGEMNAVLEHASPDGKKPGAREPGADAPRSQGYAVPPGAASSRAAAERARFGWLRRRHREA